MSHFLLFSLGSQDYHLPYLARTPRMSYFLVFLFNYLNHIRVRTRVSAGDCHMKSLSCHLKSLSCHLKFLSCHLKSLSCHLRTISCHLRTLSCHLKTLPCHLTIVLLYFCITYINLKYNSRMNEMKL